MKTKKLLLVLLMVFIAPWMAMAQQTQTATFNNSTGPNWSYFQVPVNGLNADYGCKAQFIIPATDLANEGITTGATISAIKFYCSTMRSQKFFGDAAEVEVGEVANTSFSSAAFVTSGLTLVSTGNGTANTLKTNANSELEIPFNSSYTYNGGNLLISIGGYGDYYAPSNTYWYGVSSNNAAVHEYNDEDVDPSSIYSIPSSIQNGGIISFAPMTTITYTASVTPSITLDPASVTIFTGSTETLTAIVGNVSDTPTITYTSSATNVATVSGNGYTATVTAVAPGTATITASMTVNGTPYTATSIITVEDPHHCIPVFSNSPEYIAGFTLGSIDNNNSGWSTGGYGDFTALSTDLDQGAAETATLTCFGMSGAHAIAVWIDFNDDFIFESSERIGTKDGIYVNDEEPTSVSVDLAIPSDAAGGSHTMRVVFQYNVTASNIDPCVSGTYGEAEDYSVFIIAPCSVPTDLNATNLTAVSATLSWTSDAEEFEMEYALLGNGNSNVSTFDFEGGTLQGWTNLKVNQNGGEWLHSNNQPNGYNYSNQAHGGRGFALSFSYVDEGEKFEEGGYNTNVYLVSPQRYQINSGASLNFWYNYADQHDFFEVCVATVATPTASDFTSIWTPNAKGNRAWTEANISLSNYEGQSIWIAIHHQDSNKHEVWIDDITIDAGAAISWISVTDPITTTQYTLSGLTPSTSYVARVRALCNGIDEPSLWSDIVNFTTLEGYTKDIIGYGNSNNAGGYYLIASPIGSVNLGDVTNLLENEHDLYYFDQAAPDGLEWINYLVDNNFTSLESGKGYLYANINDVTLIFTGSAYSGNGQVTLSKTAGTEFEGWNLVGNPFADTAYLTGNISFYTMNSTGDKIIAQSGSSIAPMEGVFVIAQTNGETITFTTENSNNGSKALALNLGQDNSLVDRAIVRFDEGRQLPKFQLNSNSTKVYIPQNGNDYAVTSSEEVGEMPVNFKAESNGNYSLSYEIENTEFAYLRLIDNITGKEVDLLETPSYSFVGKTTDPANRFKLVYATGTLSVSENFAFFNNGSFVINNEGDATVQVIDINGRIIKSESINGNANVNINAAAGVYMIRLINGENVMVQKVVVR